MQRRINERIVTETNNSWDEKLRQLTKGDKKLWNISKQLRNKTGSVVDKIKIQGQSCNDTDKANYVAEIFKEAHSITAEYTHPNDSNIRSTVNAFNFFGSRSCPSINITMDEVFTIIKTLKPFKAPGPDTIQNVLLKNLPHSSIIWLTAVLNKCIQLYHWPTSFKIAKVIPILKGGKPPSDPRSYRPISLLNSIGKILEKIIIYRRLIVTVEEKQLLPEYQFGFRRGHSTTHQAARIKKIIQTNKHQKKSTGMILLDIEKAFDSIWHDGLIYKLIKMKLSTYLVKMINVFIRNRKFAVHINNSVSNHINIQAGLAQGTCISPILYPLFVADMPLTDNTETALYADDTAVITSAKQSRTIVNRLNETFISLHKFFDQWKIKINSTKTQAIIFPFDNKKKEFLRNS